MKLEYNLNKTKIIITTIAITIFISALVLTVMELQNQQETRSRADSRDIYNAFDVTDTNGSNIPYKNRDGVRVYETNSLNVNIEIKDLERLTQE